MSSASELRQRLNAVKQTRQITNAMYLLSTSRMKKSMQNIDFNLEYMRSLRRTMKDILSKTSENHIGNSFIEKDNEGTALFIAVTSDKGLCGGYNSDIVKLTLSEMKNFNNPILASFGNIGSDAFSAAGVEPDFVWYDVLQHPSLHISSIITDVLIDLYNQPTVNEAYIVYTEYENQSVQKPVCKRILPLIGSDFLDIDSENETSLEPIYEPSAEEFFKRSVPLYLTGYMYNVFMQSIASENAARMTAMQNATENADEMIASLSSKINAARQLAITNEIIEIAAASEMPGSV